MTTTLPRWRSLTTTLHLQTHLHTHTHRDTQNTKCCLLHISIILLYLNHLLRCVKGLDDDYLHNKIEKLDCTMSHWIASRIDRRSCSWDGLHVNDLIQYDSCWLLKKLMMAWSSLWFPDLTIGKFNRRLLLLHSLMIFLRNLSNVFSWNTKQDI